MYNNINPDQNDIPSFNYSTDYLPEVILETSEKKLNDIDITKDTDRYISEKVTIELGKLNNKYEKNSWQRCLYRL